MKGKIASVVACLLLGLMLATIVEAAPMFVATAKNFRGAMYMGCGPSPCAATQAAVAKCCQDSFFARSCKVLCVRMEMPPPPPPMPAMYKPIRKAKPQISQPFNPGPLGQPYNPGPPPPYQWGRPMQ